MIARIKFIKPDGADVHDIAEFILDALSTMGGCRHPEDPLFHSLTIDELVVHGKKFTIEKEDA